MNKNPTPPPSTHYIKKQNDPIFGYDKDIEQDSNRSKDRVFDTNDPSTCIEMLRIETASDYLLQRSNATELVFNETTLCQFKMIMGRDAKANLHSPCCNRLFVAYCTRLFQNVLLSKKIILNNQYAKISAIIRCGKQINEFPLRRGSSNPHSHEWY